MNPTPCLLFLVSLAAAMLAGCRTVPVSGRTQLMLSSRSSENALGASAYAEYKQQYRKSTNATYNNALARVGSAIKNVAGQDDFDWEFTVLESNDANAFCLPGGKVAVYSGLFKYTDNDAELACVVAHEIAHAIARHGGERMSWSRLQTLGLYGLMYGTNSSQYNGLYGTVTDVGLMLPFSRGNETEADLIGLELMARAGYQPDAAVSFWEKFGSDSGGTIQAWLSTHPSGTTRVKDLTKALPAAQEEYARAADKKGYGQKL